MPGSIYGKIVCRDVDLLPESDADLKDFFDDAVVPALYADFKRLANIGGGGSAVFTRDASLTTVLDARGCTAEGGFIWNF